MSYCDHLVGSSSKITINKTLKRKHSFTPCACTHTHTQTILKMLSRICASSIANLKSCGTATPSRAASINYWLSSGDLSKSLNHINLKITSLMWSAECARCKAICLPRRHSKPTVKSDEAIGTKYDFNNPISGWIPIFCCSCHLNGWHARYRVSNHIWPVSSGWGLIEFGWQTVLCRWRSLLHTADGPLRRLAYRCGVHACVCSRRSRLMRLPLSGANVS